MGVSWEPKIASPLRCGVYLKATPLAPQKIRNISWTAEDLSASPDGQRLAFATNRNGPTQIWISRIDGNQSRVLVPAIPPFERYGDRTGVDSISYSPDGKWIAIETFGAIKITEQAH